MKDALEPLRVTYDAEANGAYIYFVPEIEAGGVARTVPVDGGEHPWMVNIDVGADGQILGLEVLDARRLLDMGAPDRPQLRVAEGHACRGQVGVLARRTEEAKVFRGDWIDPPELGDGRRRTR